MDPKTAQPYEEEPEVMISDDVGGPLDGGDPKIQSGPVTEDVPDDEKESINGPRI
jgi:hypothetical protein